ncbi:hypothetical protein ABVT39_012644 [Epinephelus coioides]
MKRTRGLPSPLPEGSSSAGAAYIRASKMPLIGHSCTCCQRFSRHRLCPHRATCAPQLHAALIRRPTLSNKLNSTFLSPVLQYARQATRIARKEQEESQGAPDAPERRQWRV